MPGPPKAARVSRGSRCCSARQDEEEPEPVRDEGLSEAADRMTEAARPAGEVGLLLSTAEWTALVQQFITSRDSQPERGGKSANELARESPQSVTIELRSGSLYVKGTAGRSIVPPRA